MADLWDDVDTGEAEAGGLLALRLVTKLMEDPALRPLLVAALRDNTKPRSNLGVEHKAAEQARQLLAEHGEKA